MPNPVNPKALVIVFITSATQEVVGFVVHQLPEMLLQATKERALNYGIQYGTAAITLAGPKLLVELDGPAKLFHQTYEKMAAASSPEVAASQGLIAASAFALAGVSGADPQTSMAYGTFIALLCKHILLSQGVIAPNLVVNYTTVYIVKKVVSRFVLEVQVEIKRRQLGLPRKLKLKKVKFSKLNPFRKRKKSDYLTMYVPRLKKRRFKVFSRKISLPIPYQKKIKIKASPMVEHIKLPSPMVEHIPIS